MKNFPLLSTNAKVLIAVLAALFAFYVWPTPYTVLPYHGSLIRINRISGSGRILTPDGWYPRTAKVPVNAGKPEDHWLTPNEVAALEFRGLFRSQYSFDGTVYNSARSSVVGWLVFHFKFKKSSTRKEESDKKYRYFVSVAAQSVTPFSLRTDLGEPYESDYEWDLRTLD